MKNLLIILFSTFLLFFRCDKPVEPKTDHTHSQLIHSSGPAMNTAELNEIPKTAIKQISPIPIKIIKATLHKNNYSDHKDIKLTFKNIGKKNIKAIKFEWFCVNSFDEPANGRFFYGEGRFTENSIHLLNSNQSKTEFWEDFSTDADKIIEIRAYYITYTDGTKWELNDNINPLLLGNLEKYNSKSR